MSLNIELLKKIRERIATIPESYDQSAWAQVSNKSPCGTAACLAGEAIICAAPTVKEGIKELHNLNNGADDWAVARRASKLLGLEGDFAELGDEDNLEDAGETVMFDGNAEYWPRTFREQFHDGDESLAAVAYLDHIIETGKVLE